MNESIIHHFPVENGAIAYAWSHKPVRAPLVMLHGLGDSATLTFQPRLRQSPLGDTPALFIDLPGFGESRFDSGHSATIRRYAADVADVLIFLGLGPASVFGHSMGGNVAIHLAFYYPRHVHRLVVAEPLLDPGQSILAADIARFTEDTFVARRYPMLVRATSMQAFRGNVAAAAFLEPLQLASPIALHRAASSLIANAAEESGQMLQQLSSLRAMLIGERTIADTSPLEAAQIPLTRIPNAGHNMLVEEVFHTTYAILKSTT